MNSNFHMKQKLTLEELGLLESEMLKKRKNKEAAWGLWFGLSFFGAHRFYTENYGYASIMLSTSLFPIIGIMILLTFSEFNGIINFLFGLFMFCLVGSLIWSWIDAFFLNKRIETLNNEIEEQILLKILNQKNAVKLD